MNLFKNLKFTNHDILGGICGESGTKIDHTEMRVLFRLMT